MALQLLETRAVSEQPFEPHLDPQEIAAYVDGARTGDARAHIESHLAACTECRAEVAEVSRLLATMRGRSVWRHVWIPALAAAAVLLLFVGPLPISDPTVRPHRDAPVTTTIAPRALAPLGAVDSVSTLAWSSVPRADRYHVRLFDAEATVVWQRETSDTIVALPVTLRLQPERSYYWKVEATTGFDRRAASELVEFSVRRRRGP